MSNGLTKIRLKKKDKTVLVRVIVKHPMRSRARPNPKLPKQTKPPHFLNNMTVYLNDKAVINLKCGGGVSKNPFFGFEVNGAKPKDVIKVSWKDNLGKSGGAEAVVD